MGIDLFGIIWLLLCFTSVWGNIKYISSLLLLSAIFQTSTVLSLGSLEFSPFFITELFFILKAAFIFSFSSEKFTLPIWMKYLLLFASFAILITVFSPYLFEGIRVLSPSMGIDDGVLRGGKRLLFSNSNIAQIVLLIVNMLTIFYAYLNRRKIDFTFLFNTFLLSVCLILVLGFWRYLSAYGFIVFPSNFFDNNQGHAILASAIVENRFRFTANFLEASSAGQFLSAIGISLLLLKSKKSYILMAVTFLGLILTISGAGYVGLIIGFVIWGLKSNYKQLVQIFIVGIFIVLVLYLSGFLELFYSVISTKSETASGVNRSASNIFSFRICLETYLFGAGMGSSRCSSFLFNLLATVGVLGTFLYYRFLIVPLKRLYANSSFDKRIDFLFMFGILFSLNQIISAPDLSNQYLWVWLFLFAIVPAYQEIQN